MGMVNLSEDGIGHALERSEVDGKHREMAPL